jgi:hypothetical protein
MDMGKRLKRLVQTKPKEVEATILRANQMRSAGAARRLKRQKR